MKTGIHLHWRQTVPSTSSSSRSRLARKDRNLSISEMAGTRKTRSNHQPPRSPAALALPPSEHHSNQRPCNSRGRFVRKPSQTTPGIRRCNVNTAAAARRRPDLPPVPRTLDRNVSRGPAAAQHPSLEEPAVGSSTFHHICKWRFGSLISVFGSHWCLSFNCVEVL